MNHRLINLDEYYRQKNHCHSHWDQLTYYLRTKQLLGQRTVLIGRTSNSNSDIWKEKKTIVEHFNWILSKQILWNLRCAYWTHLIWHITWKYIHITFSIFCSNCKCVTTINKFNFSEFVHELCAHCAHSQFKRNWMFNSSIKLICARAAYGRPEWEVGIPTIYSETMEKCLLIYKMWTSAGRNEWCGFATELHHQILSPKMSLRFYRKIFHY